jgi:hypothetical protein
LEQAGDHEERADDQDEDDKVVQEPEPDNAANLPGGGLLAVMFAVKMAYPVTGRLRQLADGS